MSKKKEHKPQDDADKMMEEEIVETLEEALKNAEKDAPPEAASDEGKPDSNTETIESVKSELSSANDRFLRLMAEFDNYKKRTTREYQRMVESANEKLMKEMISIRNTFELAVKHGETSTDYQKLFDGVKLIFTKFDEVLKNNGLVAFAEKGEPFDPQMHEALMKSPHDEIPDDHIADIYEKGYRLHERIIRHAKVIVSSGKPAAAEEKE